MSQREQQPQLVMMQPDLAGLPEIVVPEGFGLRNFRPGEEAVWVSLCDAAFDEGPHGPGFFYERLDDWEIRPERIWFATVNDEPVAMATAWHRARWGANSGYVHWVAANKAWRGHGLGTLVTLAALTQMRREGRDTAVLETDDFRVPAIRAYLRLGMRPRLVHENQRPRWREVLSACGREPGDYATELDGPLRPPADAASA